MEGLLLISAKDNVAVALKPLAAGSTEMLSGQPLVVRQTVKLGDKVAARDLAAGEIILKYGVPIGSATRAIPAGEHVHLHNMRSDYLPTYTLEDGHLFVQPGH